MLLWRLRMRADAKEGRLLVWRRCWRRRGKVRKRLSFKIMNMTDKNFGRREFIRSTGFVAIGTLLSPSVLRAEGPAVLSGGQRADVLGGGPVRTKAWPGWPVWNKDTDEKLVVD